MNQRPEPNNGMRGMPGNGMNPGMHRGNGMNPGMQRGNGMNPGMARGQFPGGNRIPGQTGFPGMQTKQPFGGKGPMIPARGNGYNPRMSGVKRGLFLFGAMLKNNMQPERFPTSPGLLPGAGQWSPSQTQMTSQGTSPGGFPPPRPPSPLPLRQVLWQLPIWQSVSV